jgi:hypothetical protein
MITIFDRFSYFNYISLTLPLLRNSMSSSSSSSSLIPNPVVGYKSFGPDWKCRDFQFEVGKTYELPEGQTPILCSTGFHFCQIPTDCNDYYPLSDNPRHAIIWAWDVIDGSDIDNDKSVCRKIRIVEEIPLEQWDKMTGTFVSPIRTVHLLDGQYHRDDGPAIEVSDGTKHWYRNGQRHREDGPAIELSDGHKEWHQNGQFHREDGPAREWSDGSKDWYRNGQLHREDGPAIEYSDGRKEWYRNGQLHREDVPAIEDSNGSKSWYRNGQLHREDGPAMEYSDGTKCWYRNGKFHQSCKADGPAISH